ncbi:uncharacterized protein LOC123320882 [Coccinella septempunctata]|uniref:uncharacterized protein LOC123320882 n=1 Tax=Coccinella septempunctata TaxID=41139 RepID=UPI001D069839|nr:uncharacterized protein LOC123320882 [Coccinella septempunctata]
MCQSTPQPEELEPPLHPINQPVLEQIEVPQMEVENSDVIEDDELPEFKSKLWYLYDIGNFFFLIYVSSCFQFSFVQFVTVLADLVNDHSNIHLMPNNWKLLKLIYLFMIMIICFSWIHAQLLFFTLVRYVQIFHIHYTLSRIFGRRANEQEVGEP